LFKVSDDFDFLCAFNNTNIEELLYIGEGPLLNKLFVTYLNYYKNYLSNLNEVYFNTGHRFDDICDNILRESGNVITRMENISKTLGVVTTKKYDDSESLLLEYLSKVSFEFSFFKGIFSNFNKVLQNISAFYDNVIEDLNSSKKKNVRSNVIFFNNENLLKYILESNLDMECFSESRNLLKDILNEHSKLLEKLAALERKLDRDYIYIEHSDYFDSM
jgi:Mg2+ and Co2+ transporter CorA